MTRLLLFSAALAAGAGCSTKGQHTSGGDDDRADASICTTDCNGALPTTQCALLDPARYAGGLAFCRSDCTVDASFCRPHPPQGALEPCTGTGPGNCQSGLVCLRDATEALCVEPCVPNSSTPCSDPNTTCQLAQGKTDAGCFTAPPVLPADDCPQAGMLACAGDLLQRCSPLNTWGIEKDCAIAGETCVDPPIGVSRCAGPDECFNPGVIRCGSGERLQACDGVAYQTTDDCGAVFEVCAEITPGVFGCHGADGCVTPGETRCTADRLETCDGATFRFTGDCAANGEFCRADAAGYACVPATSVCAYVGHNPSRTAAFFDTDVLDRLWLVADTPAASATERLALEILPELYRGATFPLQIDLADHASRDTCTFCVNGLRQLDQFPYDTAPTFMPSSGTATIDLFPTQPGDWFSVTFHNVVMREVEITPGSNQTTDVPGGELWCLTDEIYATSTTRFLCSALNNPLAEGERVCNDSLTQMRCHLGFLDSVDCYGQGRICADSAPPGSATCELCQGPAICRDTQVVHCDAGAVSLTDCATGETCMVPAAGQDAQCQGCDHTGVDAIWWAPFFDNDVMRYMSVAVLNNEQTEVLFVENFPDFGGLGAPGTYVIQPSDTMASGVRVYLGIYDAVSGAMLQRFFARAGTIDFTVLPELPGDFVNITITDLRLQEVDLQWQDLPGGESWCVPYFNIGGQTVRFPCAMFGGVDLVAGESRCNGTQIVDCVEQPAPYPPTVAEQVDCADLGLVCVDTTSGTTETAACQ